MFKFCGLIADTYLGFKKTVEAAHNHGEQNITIDLNGYRGKQCILMEKINPIVDAVFDFMDAVISSVKSHIF